MNDINVNPILSIFDLYVDASPQSNPLRGGSPSKKLNSSVFIKDDV